MGVRPKSLFAARFRRFPALTPKSSETPTAPMGKIWKILANVAIRMTDLAKVLVGFWLIGLTVLVFVRFSSLWSRSDITINPVDVSKRLEDEGFTGHNISDLLRLDMTAIHESARGLVRSVDLRQFAPTDSPLVADIFLQQASLPGTGVSINTVTEFILDALGRPPATKISGSLRRTDQSTILMLRIGKQPEIAVRSPLGKACEADCIDNLIQEAAEQAYREVDPFALAVYYYDHYSKNNHDRLDFSISRIAKPLFDTV